MKYCPYCQNEVDDESGCCHESSAHMITLEEMKEYDPSWYQEILEEEARDYEETAVIQGQREQFYQEAGI